MKADLKMEAKFKEKAEAEKQLKEKIEMKRKAEKFKVGEEMKLKKRVEMKEKAAAEAELEGERKKKSDADLEAEGKRRKTEKVKVALNILLEALIMEAVLTVYMSPVPVSVPVPACLDTDRLQLGNCLEEAEVLYGGTIKQAESAWRVCLESLPGESLSGDEWSLEAARRKPDQPD